MKLANSKPSLEYGIDYTNVLYVCSSFQCMMNHPGCAKFKVGKSVKELSDRESWHIN